MKRRLIIVFLCLNIFSVIDLKGAAPADELSVDTLALDDDFAVINFFSVF